MKANKSEINDASRVGHTGKSPGDDDGDDYYDYYNELVGKGADYNNENDEKDEVRKGGIASQQCSREYPFLNLFTT